MADLHAQGFDHAWPETDFIAHLNNKLDIALGSFEGDHLCGFILIRAQDDQGEILTIVVEAGQQGAGLGEKLLRAGESAAKTNGVEIIFLDVAKDNQAALALYKNAGYQICGQRPGYYRRKRGRVDALLFQKHI
ncbi:MAG: GNAT family N-acetyltransferase [Robiginitomaculum sp.]|nr:GNAT family N-acetyltransferase [Robiginitomaculum sp.]